MPEGTCLEGQAASVRVHVDLRGWRREARAAATERQQPIEQVEAVLLPAVDVVLGAAERSMKPGTQSAGVSPSARQQPLETGCRTRPTRRAARSYLRMRRRNVYGTCCEGHVESDMSLKT
ncbi:hypothetical protein [Nannocystis bainbridge]|uniref:Uncharacterized protein n=1 Tax=Nannocystis bainbridge TaxID=2995303 RepID=A0ABT5E1I4_9BACT|nr:hypothetical protein [Nannocystis bainbridge]MDC0718576.1 hypothetical protein [Nannocystis bainbridge]